MHKSPITNPEPKADLVFLFLIRSPLPSGPQLSATNVKQTAGFGTNCIVCRKDVWKKVLTFRITFHNLFYTEADEGKHATTAQHISIRTNMLQLQKLCQLKNTC